MADQKQLEILKKGSAAWNEWRKGHSDVRIDLKGVHLADGHMLTARLQEAGFQSANLMGANLRAADLGEAVLIGVNLQGADLMQARLRGAKLLNANLSRVNLIQADLRGAQLLRANLREADLSGAILVGANLLGAELIRTRLHNADLQEAIFNGDYEQRFHDDYPGTLPISAHRTQFLEPDMSEANLSSVNLSQTSLSKVNFSGANLRKSDLSGSDLSQAQLAGANLSEAELLGAYLGGADLSGAILLGANLHGAYLVGADFRGADLYEANLKKADLSHADFRGSNLCNSNLVGANVSETRISGSRVYGVSAWDLKGEFKAQRELIITPHGESVITVDNIKVAQFIHLILSNKEIRDVLDVLTSKSVLILGRFSIPERKEVLDALKNKLREHNLLPIVFDFDRPTDKDFTETIKTLAGMSYFVIADVTNPKSSPLELQSTVPDYQIPFVPIIQDGESPFAMMVDLQKKYNWVLNTVSYDSQETLMKVLKPLVIDAAMKKRQELRMIKAQEPEIISAKDYLERGKE